MCLLFIVYFSVNAFHINSAPEIVVKTFMNW